ncbi:MAG: Gfo/Idh/MocA family oxidoreductase, partial [Pararheinheimera sp.]|nr:Gfo/Idh/MocA family oxidoreductase [Rheinheimera sp.]
MELKLAIIGCGTKATQYIQTWIVRSDIQLLAVMDPNGKAMDNVCRIAAEASKAAPLCFDSWQTLLKEQHQQLDAVYICTPHANHAEQALLALELGLDV